MGAVSSYAGTGIGAGVVAGGLTGLGFPRLPRRRGRAGCADRERSLPIGDWSGDREHRRFSRSKEGSCPTVGAAVRLQRAVAVSRSRWLRAVQFGRTRVRARLLVVSCDLRTDVGSLMSSARHTSWSLLGVRILLTKARSPRAGPPRATARTATLYVCRRRRSAVNSGIAGVRRDSPTATISGSTPAPSSPMWPLARPRGRRRSGHMLDLARLPSEVQHVA